MSKATYRRKGILLGLTVSQNELRAIMVGKMKACRQVGRHGTEVVDECSHLEIITMRQRKNTSLLEMAGCLKLQNQPPVSHLLIIPKQLYLLGTKHSNLWVYGSHPPYKPP